MPVPTPPEMLRAMDRRKRRRELSIYVATTFWAIGWVALAVLVIALLPRGDNLACNKSSRAYMERVLQAVESWRVDKETGADMMILGGYCPYDGTWRVCSIRRCRTIKV